MDPLSLSASIAGIISLADVVFRTVYKFGRQVKDAKSSVQSIADEINGLISVLRTLEALALDLESEKDTFDPTLSAYHLYQIKTVVDKIDAKTKKKIEKFNGSRLDGVTAQLKWPFSASETKELLDQLSSLKATITLALSADSLRKIQMTLSKQHALGMDVSVIAETAKRIEINTRIVVEDKNRQILDYFMKFSPQPNLEMSVNLRHPMTGLWLTGSPKFKSWLECPGSNMWLSGIPGAGKTVLAGSVVQEALTHSDTVDGIGVAFFFCDYKNSITWNPTNILGAIASQLARQKSEAFAILEAYYVNLHPSKGLEKTPDAVELRAKIGQMSKVFTRTIIILDGLDECGDFTEEVVEFLFELATDYDNISMALFSRDHENIRMILQDDFEHIPIAAHIDDIKLFVCAELDRRIRTKHLHLGSVAIRDEISETLIRRAEGMYVNAL